MTHFSDADSEKTKSPNQLSASEKVKTILFGVNNPKPITRFINGLKDEIEVLGSESFIKHINN